MDANAVSRVLMDMHECLANRITERSALLLSHTLSLVRVLLMQKGSCMIVMRLGCSLWVYTILCSFVASLFGFRKRVAILGSSLTTFQTSILHITF